MLTPLQFQQRADTRFADNEYQNITEQSFRDFSADIAQTFVAQAVANVPDYEPGRNYAPGFIIRHDFGGAKPVFLTAPAPGGLLPAPTSAAGDASWELSLSPATGQALSQVGTVDALRQVQGDWERGRLYVLINRLDVNGDPLPDVYVRALTASELEPEGYTIDALGTPPVPVPVHYDLATDTTAPQLGRVVDGQQALALAAAGKLGLGTYIVLDLWRQTKNGVVSPPLKGGVVLAAINTGVFDTFGHIYQSRAIKVVADVASLTYELLDDYIERLASSASLLASPSAQLTNTSVAQYVDVFLENPAAELASADGLANYAGQQLQVIDSSTNTPFASESAYLPDVQASLAAAWASGATRLLLRCQVLPLRNGLVAHAKLTFSQAVTAWLQSYTPHASGFRLFGTAFQLQNVDWTHPNGMQVAGSSLTNPGAPVGATGSPQASYAGGTTGLLMAFEFTHNKNYSFYDYVGLSAAQVPGGNGANFECCFYITQGQNWLAQVGGTTLAQGSLLGTQFRLRLEVYDDHVNWLVDGAIVNTMIGSLMATNLWPSAVLGQSSGLTNCLFGGQTFSPR